MKYRLGPLLFNFLLKKDLLEIMTEEMEASMQTQYRAYNKVFYHIDTLNNAFIWVNAINKHINWSRLAEEFLTYYKHEATLEEISTDIPYHVNPYPKQP